MIKLINMKFSSQPLYLTAREAAAELSISPATLYAYVSRGLIRSEPEPDSRAKRYRADVGIRGDRIQWLEPGQAEPCDRYLGLMDELRVALNRALFLGLEDFECHFALYPPGAFYQKHLDRFRDDDRRCVSAVLYLNDDWLPEHAGELRLYFADGSHDDVPPLGGSLVLFLSGEFPHEVLPAHRERLSLTGWFRRRGDAPL